MLVVTIEVWPHGEKRMAEVLDRVYIGNDTTGTTEEGNYDLYTSDPRGKPYPRDEREGWFGRVERHSRAGADRGRLMLACRAILALWMRREKAARDEQPREAPPMPKDSPYAHWVDEDDPLPPAAGAVARPRS